ncbi:MAG: SufD family Fe-S cluster assembly protein [Thermoproteota archaeon]
MSENNELRRVSHEILEGAYKVGVDVEDEKRSGTLLHVDQATVYSKVNEYFEGKIELMDTKRALEKYPWLSDYRWNLMDEEQDEYTKKVSEDFSGGYFMRIKPGVEVTFPLQSCLMITEPSLEQRVQNIIIAEEESKAHIITGCVQHRESAKASHLGVSEIYVKEGATLNFTMIHDWSRETMVRPRTATRIEDKGTFISNYICLRPVRDVQMYPTAFCEGRGSTVSFNTILYGHENSTLDVGSEAFLNGKNTKADMITRAIARENANIYARGRIRGENTECRGHLECRGLIVDEEALIHAIPELIARRRGAELTHEAAVGKISEKEIIYLMTRGLTRDQAASLIIRGFMDVGIMGLPKSISHEIDQIVDMVTEAS